jgi:Fanconi anemia group J protein
LPSHCDVQFTLFSAGKSLAILCSSIAWQLSEKVRLKEIDDKRRDVDAAKAAELQQAASLTTSSARTIASEQELENICPENFPIAFASEGSSIAAPAQEAGAVAALPSREDSDAAACPASSTKSNSATNASKPTSLQKALRAVVPSPVPRTSVDAARSLSVGQDDDVFQPEKAVVKRCIKQHPAKVAVSEPNAKIVSSACDPSPIVHTSGPLNDSVASTATTESNSAASPVESEKKESLSRIYICSRTHSQLSQLIKGLKSTVYTPSMAVLGSREQMCIHPSVMLSETKNEDCSKLIGGSDGSGCSFFQAANVLSSHPSMRVVWDIEDIVTKGRQFRACPYFTAKDIAERADVVFCPYNYLIDKLIRESTGIDLKNNIVIFDEAHNLEDQCREAASFTVTETLIKAVIEMLENCRHFPNCPAEASELIAAFFLIPGWIQEKVLASDGFGEQYLEFVAEQVPAQLDKMGLTRDEVKALAAKAAKVQDWHKEVIELSEAPDAFRWVCPADGKTHSVVPAFTVCMRSIQMILLVTGYAHECQIDYAICLQRKPMDAEVKVHIWCLNPGVAFKDLREQCRSVVLTSGALSVLRFRPRGCDCSRALFSCMQQALYLPWTLSLPSSAAIFPFASKLLMSSIARVKSSATSCPNSTFLSKAPTHPACTTAWVSLSSTCVASLPTECWCFVRRIGGLRC